MDGYLKIPDLARRLDVSEKTARRYIKEGRIPSRFIGNAYRVSEEDVERFLEESLVAPGGESDPKASASVVARLRELPEPDRRDLADLLANRRSWRPAPTVRGDMRRFASLRRAAVDAGVSSAEFNNWWREAEPDDARQLLEPDHNERAEFTTLDHELEEKALLT